jgi:type IV secretory pathway VirB2 component (pilin)
MSRLSQVVRIVNYVLLAVLVAKIICNAIQGVKMLPASTLPQGQIFDELIAFLTQPLITEIVLVTLGVAVIIDLIEGAAKLYKKIREKRT